MSFNPASLPALAGHVAVSTQNGSVFVGFGQSNTSEHVRCLWESTDGLWTWRALECPLASPGWPLHSAAVVALGNHILVIGGVLSDGVASDKVCFYSLFLMCVCVCV